MPSFPMNDGDLVVVGNELGNSYDYRSYAEKLALLGCEGNDTLIGGTGASHLEGHEGNDFLMIFSGNAQLVGGDGHDRLVVRGAGANWLLGEDGNDILDASRTDGLNTLIGGIGNDTATGGGGEDRLYGEAGDDSLLGGHGNDTMFGGVGHDRMNGNAGNDKLYGEEGNDTMSGGIGADTLAGGDGNDTLDGGNDAWRDLLNGGRGNDEGRVGIGDTMNGGDGVDRAVIDGSAGVGVIWLQDTEVLSLARLNVGQSHVSVVGNTIHVNKGTLDLEIRTDGDVDRIVLSDGTDFVPPPPLQSAAYEPTAIPHFDYLA